MNIQKEMTALFGNACYAYSISYIFSDEKVRNVKNLTSLVVTGWVAGYIEDDGYVAKPVQYANMILGTDAVRDVEKVKITSLNDLPEKGLYAVEYDYGTSKHFVVCQKGKIVFDSWPESNCVKYGKPTSYRRYK